MILPIIRIESEGLDKFHNIFIIYSKGINRNLKEYVVLIITHYSDIRSREISLRLGS